MRLTPTTYLIGAAAALGIGYELAISGTLGPDAKRIASGVPLLTPPAAVASADTAKLPTGLQCGPTTGSLAAMTAANGALPDLMNNWKYGTLAKNVQNLPGAGGPYDWQSFQAVLVRLGYPDPGPNPPIDFCR